jgi:hypothetical protein
MLELTINKKAAAQTYLGNLNANPYGRFGCQYSPDWINNPNGARSRQNQENPNNHHGRGLTIIGR